MKINLFINKTSNTKGRLQGIKKQNRTLCQEEPEQIGSFKNSQWKIPATAAGSCEWMGEPKCQLKGQGLFPLLDRSFKQHAQIQSASLGNSLDGVNMLYTMWDYGCMKVFFRNRNNVILYNRLCEHADQPKVNNEQNTGAKNTENLTEWCW